MADGQEKIHDPTPQRLRQARQRGQVAHSRDLTTAVVLGAGFVALAWTGQALPAEFARWLERALHGMDAASAESAQEQLGAAWHASLALCLPVLAVLLAAGVLVPFLQIGPLFTLTPLAPKAERLDPVAGLRQRLLSRRGWLQLFKSGLQCGILAWTAWCLVGDAWPLLATLHQTTPGLAAVGNLATRLVARVLGVFLGLSVLDLLYQRWQLRRDLRMSDAELRREFKDDEGDPNHRAERRRLHQELLDGAALQTIGSAHVAIANPTHLLCAVQLVPHPLDPRLRVPRLLVKGKDLQAQRLKQAARDAGIPVREDVLLARSLFAFDEGAYVPEVLWDALAVVFAWARELAEARGEVAPWERTADRSPPGSPQGVAG